ncbi:sensor histidine kinase [Halobaculum litoreum]|uniref:histidine kinase n=1 Tax=Halobaculum litoreum TaxID=3031998 RepID=A0ABD5XWA0_9EURY
MALSAFGVAVAVALARYQLLTVSPVERDAILSEVTDAILVTDRTDRLLDRNPAAAAVLDDAAGVGTDLATVDAAPVPTLLAAPCGTTTELTVAGDRTRRFDCRKIALSDDDPDGGARLYVLHDVTERREHERQLERKNERLDRFAGVVSHDLRNPLSIAMGHADLAERDPDPEHFETIADAHDRMDEIIESLLTLARTGNDVADPTPVDLGTVAERAWDQVETDDASLSVDADDLVSADSQRLAQAFENLFRNAVEHGGADVDVTVGSSPSGFYVADTGPGIPEADRDTVFDPGVTTDHGGTGVGLAIVSAVAAGHGWTVSAGEGAAGGARFDFATGEPASADVTAVTDATATDGGVRRRSPR